LAGLREAEVQPGFVAQLQATLNVIPAHTWYAAPSGVLTFVNKRTADYLGLPKIIPCVSASTLVSRLTATPCALACCRSARSATAALLAGTPCAAGG
jgi:hypothetical protein